MKEIIRKYIAVKEHGLNQRQSVILALFLTQDQIRISDIEKVCPGINRRTLQRDLGHMEEEGLLKREGAARQSFYVPGATKLR